MDHLTTFGPTEEGTREQIERCINAEEGARGVLCADNHIGYAMPIGGAVAYREHVSPSGVGYDIGCGNKAVLTNLLSEDLLQSDMADIMDEIAERISFGIGLKNNERVEHEVLDKIRVADFEPQRALYDKAAAQLGTVGSGNHYVDIFEDEEARIWIGVHFGSRGFGHTTAKGFLRMAQGLSFQGKEAPGGEMHSPPTLFSINEDIGQAYISAMSLAGEYAYAGRDVVVNKVLEIMGADAVKEIHNHHNFSWKEEHFGEKFWVVRKGCTPAFPGQLGFVGSTMAEESVILEGNGHPDVATASRQEASLFSTVHGAGRVMSRTEAAGKVKVRKRYECNNRDCSNVFNIDGINPQNPPPKKGACPDHPESSVRKVKIRERVREGKIDWGSAMEDIDKKGIELRGSAADEAPLAYKRLDDVLAAHGDTIKILHRLKPRGVAMAGAGEFDPYKD